MNKLNPDKKIDFSLCLLFMFIIAVEIFIYSQRTIIEVKNTATVLQFTVVFAVTALYIGLFRLLSQEANKLDSAEETLIDVQSRYINSQKSKISRIKRALDSEQKNILCVIAFAFTAVLLLIIYLEQNRKTAILMLLFFLVSIFLYSLSRYIKIKNISSSLKLESLKIKSLSDKRKEIKKSIQTAIKNDPLGNSNHLKGYTKQSN